MTPDTIPCPEECLDPSTGGVSGCEPRLIGVDEERGVAVYEHRCGSGIEVVEVELLDAMRAAETDAMRAEATDAALADAAASAVARDEVVGEIVEEEKRRG